MYHILKLFNSGGTSDIGMEQGKGLVSESYDEIVFQDPTQLMQYLLTNTKQLTLGRWEHHTDCKWYSNYNRIKITFLLHVPFTVEEKKEKTAKAITEAKQKVRQEINVLKNRLKLAKETISQFKEEIAKVQENQYVI